jgi:hypothetical protein
MRESGKRKPRHFAIGCGWRENKRRNLVDRLAAPSHYLRPLIAGQFVAQALLIVPTDTRELSMQSLNSGQTGRKGADDSRQAFGIEDFAKAYGIGRTIVFSEIKAGRLRAVQLGRRTLITAEDARAWLSAFPAAKEA